MSKHLISIEVENNFLRPKKYVKSTYFNEQIILIYTNNIGLCLIITDKAEYDVSDLIDVTVHQADSILCDLQDINEMRISKY